MTLGLFGIVFASVTLSALGQTAFKLGVSKIDIPDAASVLAKAMAFVFSPFVLLGLTLYAVGTVLWLFALRQLDLSVAYPFVAMSFVMVALSSVVFLGETLDPMRIVGLSLIILGILVIARTA
ncbi:SMR family transporter [Loktanella sp. Alg231-35]|uniref:SMR family transporter n=1 Tax=Loktanella sp. Alg231-35 TaxID=1922220 RepID=UPI000D54BB58|nr:SMR family transporter [Loktanella sp. Alg231-35]